MQIDMNPPAGDPANADPPSTEGTAPPSTSTPPSGGSAAAPSTPARPGKKVITVSSDAFAKVKTEARERGKKLALAEMDAAAREMGFGSHADMMEFARTKKSAPATTTATPPSEAPRRGAASGDRRTERERQTWMTERARLNKIAAHADKRRKMAERKLAAFEADQALREEAIRSGVVDIDYALHLLRKEYQGKTAAELEGMSERKFFDSLRAKQPLLFGTEERPATTGVGETPRTPEAKGAPVNGPPAAKVGEAQVNGKKVDARSLTKEQFAKLLAERGIRNPANGASY